MGIVWASPRFNKRLTIEKGKAVTIEPAEEDDNLQDLIDQIDAQAKEEEPAFQLPLLPTYLSPWTRMTKVSKDVDTAKTALQSPLLPDDIRFEGCQWGVFQASNSKIGTLQIATSSPS